MVLMPSVTFAISCDWAGVFCPIERMNQSTCCPDTVVAAMTSDLSTNADTPKEACLCGCGFQQNDAQYESGVYFLASSSVAELPVLFPNIEIIPDPGFLNNFNQPNAPPFAESVPIFLQNLAFLN